MRNLLRLSRDGRNGLADITNDAACHDGLIFNKNTEVINARHIIGGNHTLHTLHREGSRGINLNNPCIGMGTTMNRHVQHIGHPHIRRILDCARDLARRI